MGLGGGIFESYKNGLLQPPSPPVEPIYNGTKKSPEVPVLILKPAKWIWNKKAINKVSNNLSKTGLYINPANKNNGSIINISRPKLQNFSPMRPFVLEPTAPQDSATQKAFDNLAKYNARTGKNLSVEEAISVLSQENLKKRIDIIEQDLASCNSRKNTGEVIDCSAIENFLNQLRAREQEIK